MDVPKEFVVLCWAIFLGYFFVSAFFTKRTVERVGRAWRILFTVALLGALIVIRFPAVRGATFSELAGGTIWPSSLTDEIVADAITLGGLVVALWARTALGGNWSTNVEFKEKHELITRGPYQYVRHPIYSGLLFMILGAMIIYDHAVGLVIFVIIFIGFWIRSRQEEKLLTKHFPQAYPQYKTRVKALIPFVL